VPLSQFRQEKLFVYGRQMRSEGHNTGSEFRKMARKEHFVALGFALLLIGLLVAVDIVLAARTVDQLARSEVYAGTYPASSVR